MKYIFSLVLVILTLGLYGQEPFTHGNIVVVRVGVPDSALPAAATPVFLEEFSPVGKHIQTISIPYQGEAKLTIGGRSVTEGLLRRSTNGAYLTMGGYNLVPGTSNPTQNTTGADRVIARIGSDGLTDLTTRLPIEQLYPNAPIRAVVSDDGNRYWTAGGTQGLRYLLHGADNSKLISNTVTNMRGVHIQAGNVYLTHGAGVVNTRVMQVGQGLINTEDVIATPLPGLPTTNAAVCDIFFADLNTEIEGFDVLYLADDLNGLRKYSLVESNWVLNSTTGTGGDVFRGLTGVPLPGGVMLYTTFRAGNQATGGGQLGRLIDLSGYNQPITALVDVLAVATPNTGFRGIALAPVNELAPVITYVFNGNGNWDDPANWSNQTIPPTSLPAEHQIIIKPTSGGKCLLNVQQTIQQGAIFIVDKDSEFEILGHLDLK